MIHNTESDACVCAEACTVSAQGSRVPSNDKVYIMAAPRRACRLKKEMGLGHVNEDYKHRKQEHNCLEYTGLRKCETREEQEGRGP